jgi:hypothetical protein
MMMPRPIIGWDSPSMQLGHSDEETKKRLAELGERIENEYKSLAISAAKAIGVGTKIKVEKRTNNYGGSSVGISICRYISHNENGWLFSARDKPTTVNVHILVVKCPTTGDYYALTVDNKIRGVEEARRSTFPEAKDADWVKET